MQILTKDECYSTEITTIQKRITSFRPTSQQEIALQEGTRGRKIWDLEKIQGVSSSGCSGLPWPWRTGPSPWRLGEGTGRPGTAGVGGGGPDPTVGRRIWVGDGRGGGS